MNLYVIGTDTNIFNKESYVFKRVFAYSQKMNVLNIIVFSLKKNNFKQFSVGNLHVYPTSSLFKLFYIPDAFLLFLKIFKKDQKNIISSQDPFEIGLFSLLLSKLFKIPLQIQIHTDFYNYKYRKSILGKIRFFVAKFVLSFNPNVRVVSPDIKRYLISYFKVKSNIDVLPIFVNKEKIKLSDKIDLKYKFQKFENFILIASRLEVEKNVESAIMAFKKLLLQKTNTLLLICGDGSRRGKLELLVKSLNIEKNVIFLGWQENIFSYMKSVDLFISTSDFEGYGMSVVEAGLCGCPIICTKTGIANDIFIDGESCLFVDNSDISDISGKMYKILSDKFFSQNLVLNAFKVLDNTYSFEKYVFDYVNLLKKCIS